MDMGNVSNNSNSNDDDNKDSNNSNHDKSNLSGNDSNVNTAFQAGVDTCGASLRMTMPCDEAIARVCVSVMSVLSLYRLHCVSKALTGHAKHLDKSGVRM